MPGETLVIADLKGPGVVCHIWFTAAGNEFAWPRLFRLRAYYDGKKTPSVDAPLGDFFGVGNGYERDLNSAMVRNTLDRPGAQQLLADAVPQVLPDHGDQRRRADEVRSTTRWTGGNTPSLPADIGYFHAYYRQERPGRIRPQLRVPQHPRARVTTSARC